ncbi:MAG: ribosome biogenesis GTPase Der [Deltaproteobacteria bacterium]
MKGTSRKMVALVGRPNVGKSTMFNMLVGVRKALVEDTPGLTRDRNYAEVTVQDKTFVVVDTGGFEPTSEDALLSQMRMQTMVAIEQADLIVFLGDGKVGITPSDREIVRTLEQTDKKVFYAVNKIDSEKFEDLAVDFYSVGVEQVFPVSAMTGYGMGELLDALLEEIPTQDSSPQEGKEHPEPLVKLAVVGRPNVGKSTLINLLLGKERLLAHSRPGTTRDSIDTIVRHHGTEYLFTDTAGIRRRSRIVDRVEKYSVIKSFRSIDRSDIVLLIMDATEPLTEQDARIAGYAFEKGRAIIILLNKWDLLSKDSNTHKRYVERVRHSLKYIDHAPVLTISALKGTRASRIFDLIRDLDRCYRKRVSTSALNRLLEDVVSQHPPGMHRGKKRIKIYYLTQVRVAPPSFLLFCNYPESIHFSYRRFLENRLRDSFDFGGSPIRLVFRKREEKTSHRGKKRRPDR